MTVPLMLYFFNEKYTKLRVLLLDLPLKPLLHHPLRV